MRRLWIIRLICACVAMCGFAATAEGSGDVLPLDGIDVFEFNRLSPVYVQGSEMSTDGDYQDYLVYLRDGVYFGGSEGYYENWVTESGVLCDTTIDLDGDGRREYLTYGIRAGSNAGYGDGFVPATGHLVAFGMSDGGYAEFARIDDIGDLMPMGVCEIRLIDAAEGVFIAEACYGIGDGGEASMTMRVYRYDDGRFAQELHAVASSRETSWIAKSTTIGRNDYELSAAIYDYVWNNDPSGLRGYGLTPDENLFIYPYDYDWEDPKMDYTGFDELSDELSPYGMSLSYRVSQAGYQDVLLINGGKTLLHVSDNSTVSGATELRLLTSMDHKPEMFSVAMAEYDDFGEESGDHGDEYGDHDRASDESAYACITGDVNMRDQPSIDGQIIMGIANGSTVEFLGDISTDARGVDWYCVSYNGYIGWISSKNAVLQAMP